MTGDWRSDKRPKTDDRGLEDRGRDEMAERGCLKWGCMGCGGLGLFSIVFFAFVAALQISNSAGPRDLQEFRYEQQLPVELERLAVVPRLGANSDEGSAGVSTEGAIALDLPRLPSPELDRPAGRLVLDISVAELEVRPGPPGSSISVEAEYDTSDFELSEDWSEGRDGEWTYTVRFEGSRSWFGMLTSGAADNPGNRIIIRVPPDLPFDLDADLGAGEFELELGGLWIRNVDIDAGAGQFHLLFSEPTQVAMGSLVIDSGVGEVRVQHLGNASPERVDLQLGIGDLRADLRGPWIRDARVVLDCGIGECGLRVPEDVFVDLDDADVGLGEKRISIPDQDLVPEGAPTLTLELSGGLGAVRVDS